MNKTKLGDICKICSSKRVFESEYKTEGIPFIRGLEITDGSLMGEKAKYECYISVEHYMKLKKEYGVPQKGDILITAVGTIGNLCYIDKEKPFYFKDGNIIWFKNFKNDVYPKFLYYFMKSPYFKKQIECALIGAVQKALTMVMLSEIKINLPEYKKQIEIANALDLIETKIQNSNRINSELESLAKTLYDYWFLQFEFPNEEGKPYKSSGGKMVWNEELKREIPEGWTYETLKNKYSVKRGISYTSKDIESGKGIPMINLACIDTERNYRDGELKYFNGQINKECRLNAGDMLIATTDLTRNADIVGCPIIVPYDNLDYTYTMDLAKFEAIDKKLNKWYTYSSLRTKGYHNFIKRWASGTNVLHLNLDGIDWYKMFIPKKDVQEKFAVIMENVCKKQSGILEENRKLSSLRDWLLPMLMNGQVTFKDENISS